MPSLIRISCALLMDVAPCVRRCGTRWAAASRAAHGEAGGTRGDFADKIAHDTVEGHGAEVVAAAVTQAHGTGLRFTAAAHEHVGHLVQLRLADAVAELLV